MFYFLSQETCADIKCANYAKCVTINRQPTCQCPKESDCITKKLASVCGSDGVVYDNECYMEVTSCEAGQLITKKNDGICGMLNDQLHFSNQTKRITSCQSQQTQALKLCRINQNTPYFRESNSLDQDKIWAGLVAQCSQALQAPIFTKVEWDFLVNTAWVR